MKVIILCAGYATRLYPLTKDKPKPLLLVAGKPIIEYILSDIEKEKEVDRVYVVTNDKFSNNFNEWAEDYSYSVPVEVVNDNTKSNDDRLGAIGDIYFTVSEKKIDDDLLIVAGDNLFDLDISEFLAFAKDHAPHATIAAYDVGDKELAKKYGLVELDENQQVIDFQEKPAKPKTTLASLGLYYYPKASLSFLHKYIKEGNNPDQPGHYAAYFAREDKLFAYAFFRKLV